MKKMNELDSMSHILKDQNNHFSLENTAHIAVFERNLLDKVLNGEKKLMSSFSKDRCVPYDSIDNGDTIFLKEIGGPIIAKAKADKITFYANLNSDKIKIFKYTYSALLCVDDDFWDKEKNSLYATMFTLKDIEDISPIPTHESDQQPWIVINKETDIPEYMEEYF